MEQWTIILLAAVALVVAIVVTALVVREKDRKKVAYMLDAFEDGELNFRFTENSAFNKTLNRIRWIFEKQRQRNEQESWTKLIRVLTHEIMNTVSPISSLSDALGKCVDVPEDQREIDVKAGLETISNSSKDLIKFVESYRELAGVAKPIKKAVMVDELVNRVMGLTSQKLADKGVKCSYAAAAPDLLIYADEGQLSQILVNLIKNASEAGAKNITIKAGMDRLEQTIIEVANDGEAISKESQEQIFVPFFTTKPTGSGIGLSLSRQIMNQHNGRLDLVESNETRTAFAMIFR